MTNMDENEKPFSQNRKKSFTAIRLNTKGFKFNREAANERCGWKATIPPVVADKERINA